MAAKRRVRATKVERKTRRSNLGPLRALTVAQKTKKIYQLAMAAFDLWMTMNRVLSPEHPEDLDTAMRIY